MYSKFRLFTEFSNFLSENLFDHTSKKNIMKNKVFAVLFFPVFLLVGVGDFVPVDTPLGDPSAKEIVRKSTEKLIGNTSQGEMKMTIVRPTWKREITMKSWSLGEEYALILVTGPARDKGTAFLKKGKEVWNWQPTIDRSVKLPPSMMSQSLMGSDFTNNDMVDQASVIDDYTHKLLGEEEIDGRPCYKIEMTPEDDAAIVWGKVISWIDKEDFLQLRAEFYDEEDYLVNTMKGMEIKELGGKLLPSRLEITPEEEPENKTIIEYISLSFDKPIKKSFFSVQNMKRVR